MRQALYCTHLENVRTVIFLSEFFSVSKPLVRVAHTSSSRVQCHSVEHSKQNRVTKTLFARYKLLRLIAAV